MKKLFLFILAFFPIIASADVVEVNGVYYQSSDDYYLTAEVTSPPIYKENVVNNNLEFLDYKYSGDIKIVPYVTFKNKGSKSYKVTRINSFSFGNTEITSITIPNSIEYIGGSAFYNCKNLTSVTIPGSVKTIDQDAFWGCSGLTSIELQEGVTTIKDGVFKNCSSLTSITIPSSVNSISKDAFSGCNNLKSVNIIISDLSAWVSCKIGSAFDSSIEMHYIYNGEEITDLVIPDGVTSIGDYVFAGCSSMTTVTIPSSVTSIGKDAFKDCKNVKSVYISDLTAWCKISFKTFASNPIRNSHSLSLNGNIIEELVIPEGVTSINDYAFYRCFDLTSVSIPNSVTTIGDWVFEGCKNLTSISIPSSVTAIGGYAFSNCQNLTSIIIPSSVTTIGDLAFSSSGITSIIIPKNVKSIGVSIFLLCKDLKSISVEEGNSFFESDEKCNVIIESKTKKMIANLWNTIIPDGVTSISQAVLWSLNGKTIIIPQSVNNIDIYAFEYCSNLKAICCLRKEPPTCYDETFNEVGKKCIIWVQKGCVDTYKKATGWKDFQNIQEIIDGDYDLDGKVDGEDVSTLANNISNASADANIGDINGDDEVNVADVVALINKMNGQALLGETAFYLIGDHNGWDMTDKTYAFTKLADGKTWEITIPSEGAGCFKIAPGSAYDHQDGTFWSYLLCAEYDQYTGLHGIMQQGDIMAAWLLNTEGATSYTIRIVPSEMTYKIIPN